MFSVHRHFGIFRSLWLFWFSFEGGGGAFGGRGVAVDDTFFGPRLRSPVGFWIRGKPLQTLKLMRRWKGKGGWEGEEEGIIWIKFEILRMEIHCVKTALPRKPPGLQSPRTCEGLTASSCGVKSIRVFASTERIFCETDPSPIRWGSTAASSERMKA